MTMAIWYLWVYLNLRRNEKTFELLGPIDLSPTSLNA